MQICNHAAKPVSMMSLIKTSRQCKLRKKKIFLKQTYFQRRLTVTLKSVRNHQKSTKNSAARPSMVQNHAAQSASTARTSENWTKTSAISRGKSTQLAKCCREIQPTSVAKRVSVQGCRKISFYSPTFAEVNKQKSFIR